MRSDVERFADGKKSNRKHDHVNTVQQLRHAKGKTGLSGLAIDADDSEKETDKKTRQTAQL